MSAVHFEKPPTFDVKIVGGKKIIIWDTKKEKGWFLSIHE